MTNVGFSIFSPTVFYLKEITARVVPLEVITVYLAGILSSALAAFFASGRITKMAVAEVLHYE
jgi:ABC-type lipoprotein release transport system permease subunit